MPIPIEDIIKQTTALRVATLSDDMSQQSTPISHKKPSPTTEALTESKLSADDILQKFLSSDTFSNSLVLWLRYQEAINQLPTFSLQMSREQFKNSLYTTIATIDRLVNEMLNNILHNDRVQQLEASWRGLKSLSDISARSRSTKVKVLDASWHELTKDINKSLDFEQTTLYQKVYNNSFGIAGGEPFGILLGDYYISPKQRTDGSSHISTLSTIGQIASESFAPFICGVDATFFDIDSYHDLHTGIDLNNIFNQKSYIEWNQLRGKHHARFLGLALPRVLGREPYQTRQSTYDNLHFKEHLHKKSDYLWVNACYALGCVLLREFGRTGWLSHIRGAPRDFEGGGVVTNLKAISQQVNRSHTPNTVTELVISDRLEKNLSEQGFIALIHNTMSSHPVFYNNQSVYQPQEYTSDEHTANARLSAMLQHTLCACRIAQYVKVIMRDKVGSLHTASYCEDYLSDWASQYTNSQSDLSWSNKAKQPLRNIDIKVREIPHRPGYFKSVIQVQPHYQVDNLISELSLTTIFSA